MKLRKGRTFYSYLLSYILILAISLLGIYYILNVQLKQEFSGVFMDQHRENFEEKAATANESLSNMTYVNLLLSKDSYLRELRYAPDNPYNKKLAWEELQKYIAGNSLINDIIVYFPETERTLTSSYAVTVVGEDMQWYSYNARYTLPLAHLLSPPTDNYIFRLEAPSGKPPLFVFVPPQSSQSYYVFFLLQEKGLQSLLEPLISPTMNAVRLVDANGATIYGINASLFSTGTEGDELSFPVETIRVQTLSSDIFIESRIDAKVVQQSVKNVIHNSYIIVFVIAIIGIIVTILAMRLNYNPLRRLFERVSRATNSQHPADMNDIMDIFDKTHSQNVQLQEQIAEYRMSIQQSILETVAYSEQDERFLRFSHVEHLFQAERQNCLAVVHLIWEDEADSVQRLELLEDYLQEGEIALVLEAIDQGFSVLLNFAGPRPVSEKEERLYLSLLRFQQEVPSRLAVSDCSSNPLDIARLYDNAVLATEYLQNQNFVLYSQIQESIIQVEGSDYPYAILDLLTLQLEEMEYSEATKQLKKLFAVLDIEHSKEFFVRCVLLDTLTIIMNALNQEGISSELFQEEYLQALYLCRSSDYKQTFSQIQKSLFCLLKIYEEESQISGISIAKVREYVQEHAMSSDFSVASLAEDFDTTDAYMSFLYKKQTGTNLSDYLWELRMEKAKQLLAETDKNIAEVSVKVGYENPSSFRRKFKDSTNLTPSEYRKQSQQIYH